ncbi:MAG: hypothetical protein H6577_21570 [Lewinellaceae bacterium]|nr:hypothetical protein [Saprospiraceae bacterium]MCB9340722.1 hypothetical protein [Lewinellaceae bacterium]
MLPLDKSYLEELENISAHIQAAEELASYLEEEEESFYEQLKEKYEPYIHDLYERVAAENPLQLISFEQRLMKEDFEGLFLPRLLGYSVLRGELNNLYKYTRPQTHFQEVLMAICNSANFEILKKRIGQSIQIGFALSSDIWITNLIALIENKRIRYFLQSQKLDKYRTPEGRKAGYAIYKKQFLNFNYMTGDFPQNLGELKVLWSSLKEFLLFRIERGLDNTSLLPFMKAFVENEDFKGHDEHLQILGLYAFFFDLNEADQKHLAKHFNETRKKHPEFEDRWWHFVLEIYENKRVNLDAATDHRISVILDHSIEDDLTAFYKLMDIIHGVGYVHEDTMEAVKNFYNHHQGRSLINECVRMAIFQYFAKLLNNLEVRDYHELFNLAKIYTVYIHIFANEEFNLAVKDLSMRYIKRLMKHYTDKRGRDYQDIKKFVSTTFQDLNFLKEKEVVELFKTRRKRKATEA